MYKEKVSRVVTRMGYDGKLFVSRFKIYIQESYLNDVDIETCEEMIIQVRFMVCLS